MEMNLNEVVQLSQTWWPVVLDYAMRAGWALLTLLIGWWLINKVVGRVEYVLQSRNLDRALSGFVCSMTGITLRILLLVSVASMIGIETTSFIAVIGAAGLAVGLALQGSLANFAGGVLIMIFRPFRAGDWIEAQGVAGTVDNIHIFHTTLKTADNKVVVVPNGGLSNGHIINYSRERTRRVDINIGVSYDSDIKKAREVLLDIARDPRVLSHPAPVVFVTGLGESAINLSMRVWVETADYWAVMFELTEQLNERLSAAGIRIPYQQRVVHLVKQD